MTFTLRKVLGLFQYKPDFISTDISFVGKRQSPVCFFFVMEILILEDKVSSFETDIFYLVHIFNTTYLHWNKPISFLSDGHPIPFP